jgi:hypothetical protein
LTFIGNYSDLYLSLWCLYKFCVFTGDNGKIEGKKDKIVARSEILEPFLMMRNMRLEADFYATYFNYEVGRCLDECLNRDRLV